MQNFHLCNIILAWTTRKKCLVRMLVMQCKTLHLSIPLRLRGKWHCETQTQHIVSYTVCLGNVQVTILEMFRHSSCSFRFAKCRWCFCFILNHFICFMISFRYASAVSRLGVNNIFLPRRLEWVVLVCWKQLFEEWCWSCISDYSAFCTLGSNHASFLVFCLEWHLALLGLF